MVSGEEEAATSLAIKPVADTTNVATGFGLDGKFDLHRQPKHRKEVPLIATVAKGTGAPVSSSTVPVIVLVWEMARNEKPINIAKSNRIFLM